MPSSKTYKEPEWGPITVIPGMENAPPYRSFFGNSGLAQQYCVGRGIELGAAAHNSFNLSNCANVAPFGAGEEDDFAIYKQSQIELCGYYAQVDIPGDIAAGLPDLRSGSLDYVISSHVLEHIPDLISALREIDRILKPGGICFTILPQRNALPSDASRAITPLEHFIEDHAGKVTVDTHVDPEGIPQPRRSHYHVFTLDSFEELVEWCDYQCLFRWQLLTAEDPDSKVGNGFTTVYRKADTRDESSGDLIGHFSSIGRFDLSRGLDENNEPVYKGELKWPVRKDLHRKKR